VARVPPHVSPFCRDHSRQVPVLVPIIFPCEGGDETGDLRVITSDRVCALAKRFEGQARIPWEGWKDSMTFVGHSLPRFPNSYSTRGLILFVDMLPFFMTVDPGIALRVYNCSPRLRHVPSGVAGDAGLPYDSIELPFDDWQSETVAEVEYSEDNILIHTVGGPSSECSDLSLSDRRSRRLRKPNSTSCPSNFTERFVWVHSCILYHKPSRRGIFYEETNGSNEIRG
jgi:hypothetical protein